MSIALKSTEEGLLDDRLCVLEAEYWLKNPEAFAFLHDANSKVFLRLVTFTHHAGYYYALDPTLPPNAMHWWDISEGREDILRVMAAVVDGYLQSQEGMKELPAKDSFENRHEPPTNIAEKPTANQLPLFE